jgi:hypothetical protein
MVKQEQNVPIIACNFSLPAHEPLVKYLYNYPFIFGWGLLNFFVAFQIVWSSLERDAM